MNPNLYDVLTMCPPGKMWDYVRNIPNEPSKCNQWKHFHRMSSEHLKCSLTLPTGHIVGKMHMGSKCTQHVITGFQVPSPPVSTTTTSGGTELPLVISMKGGSPTKQRLRRSTSVVPVGLTPTTSSRPWKQSRLLLLSGLPYFRIRYHSK